MADGRITEGDAVQFPMVRHAEEIGWTALSPEEALHMRGGYAGVLLRGGARRYSPAVQSLDNRGCRALYR